MITTIILIISMYPVLPIMYFVMKSEAKVNNNIVLGVTIPYNHIENIEVKENIRLYKKDLKKASLLFCPVPIISIFIKYFSIVLTINLLWIISVIAVIIFIFIKYNKILSKIKKDNEWNNAYDILVSDEYANELGDKDIIKKKLDDDEHWIYGMYYYNRNDKHIMVSSRGRSGNYIMNMATIVGKIMAVFLAVCLLSLPVTCIMAMRDEFSPITISSSKKDINVCHAGSRYSIDTGDIKSVKLLDSLPLYSKNSGTNLRTLEKGSYEVKGYGKCTLCINPVNKKFILIQTVDKKYIFSTEDDNETDKEFEKISQNLKTA